MSYDYMAFEQGMMAAEANGRQNANAWANHANGLKNELSEVQAESNGNIIVKNSAFSLMKEMKEEIRKMNPHSPFADGDYLTNRLKELSYIDANEQGFILDYHNSTAYKR